MICAITHHVAGVHRDDTMADYLETNDETKLEKKTAFLGPWIRDLTGITAPKVGLLALGSTAAGAADNITAEVDHVQRVAGGARQHAGGVGLAPGRVARTNSSGS